MKNWRHVLDVLPGLGSACIFSNMRNMQSSSCSVWVNVHWRRIKWKDFHFSDLIGSSFTLGLHVILVHIRLKGLTYHMCFTSIQDVLKTPNIINFEENTKCNALVLHRALVMQITIVLFTVLVIDLYPQRLSTSIYIHFMHSRLKAYAHQ